MLKDVYRPFVVWFSLHYSNQPNTIPVHYTAKSLAMSADLRCNLKPAVLTIQCPVYIKSTVSKCLLSICGGRAGSSRDLILLALI